MLVEQVYILLGGNEHKTKQAFVQGIQMLESEAGIIVRKSSLYLSEPWGFEAPRPFLNQVIEINTGLSAETLLETCLRIEKKLGRIRNTSGYASRIIDIDILFYNSQIIDTQKLIVPHPRLHLRRFTLLPLVELNPDFIHPILQMNMDKLLKACSDKGQVEKLP